jgi:hypothetical protein
MRYPLLILVLFFTALSMFVSHVNSAELGVEPGVSMEFYSWKNPESGWDFAILPMLNSMYTGEDVFDPKRTIHGVADLKKALLKFAGSNIYWADSRSLYQGEKVEYPDDKTIEDVVAFAKAEKLNLTIIGDGKRVARQIVAPESKK